MKRIACLFMVALFASPLEAAQRQEQSVTWDQFQVTVTRLKLRGRRVHVTLHSGEQIRGRFQELQPDALVISGKRPRVERTAVSVLRFDGRTGKKGMIGALVGLGAGVAILGAAVGGEQIEGDAAAAPLLFLPVGAVAGYLIGRGLDEPIPLFRITQ